MSLNLRFVLEIKISSKKPPQISNNPPVFVCGYVFVYWIYVCFSLCAIKLSSTPPPNATLLPTGSNSTGNKYIIDSTKKKKKSKSCCKVSWSFLSLYPVLWKFYISKKSLNTNHCAFWKLKNSAATNTSPNISTYRIYTLHINTPKPTAKYITTNKILIRLFSFLFFYF